MPTMQRGDRGPTEPGDGEGSGKERAGDHGRETGPLRVGQLAGQVGRGDPCRSDEAEQSDHRVRVVVGAPGEQERERRPEHAEPSEGARAVPGPAAQDGLGRQEGQGRADEGAVAPVRSRALGRQRSPQHESEAHHQRGREPVDGPPPGRLRDQTRDGAGQEDPHQEASHDARHHTSTALFGRQVGSEGDHDLPGHGRPADQDRSEGEEPQGRCQRAGDERDRGQEEETCGQGPARMQIAERDDEQQPRGVADLGGRDHRGRGRRDRCGSSVPPGGARAGRSRGWPPPRPWRRR